MIGRTHVFPVACLLVLAFAAGILVERTWPELPETVGPVPIYVILPDTTHLHLNSFEWICTLRPYPETPNDEAPTTPTILPDPPPSRSAGR